MFTDELNKYYFLLDAQNRAALIAEMQKAKQKYGEKWLAAFKSEFPAFVFVIDLVANYDQDEAIKCFTAYLCEKIDAADITEIKLLFPVLEYVPENLIKTFAKQQAAQTCNQNQAALIRLHQDFRAEIDKKRF